MIIKACSWDMNKTKTNKNNQEFTHTNIKKKNPTTIWALTLAPVTIPAKKIPVTLPAKKIPAATT